MTTTTPSPSRFRRRTASTLLALSLATCGSLVAANDAQASFPSAANGRIFFDAVSGDGPAEIYSINPDGTDLQQLTSGSNNAGPDVSADGSRVAFGSDRTGHYEIWTMKPDGSDQTQVTRDNGTDYYPAFSPDGSQVAYRMTTDTNPGDIFVTAADGSGTPAQLTTAAGLDSVAEWKAGPDGGLIVFHSSRDDTDPANCSPCVQSLYTMHPDGSAQTQLISVPGGRARFGNWSPDGTQIAYEHDSTLDPNTSVNEIWTANADGSDQQLFTPTQDASNDQAPDYSPDGTQLAWDANGHLQTAALDGTGSVTTIDTGGLSVGSVDWSVTAATVLTSSTTLTVTPASAVYGQPVTVRAQVTPSGGVSTAVTGTVTFSIDGTTAGAPAPLKKGVATRTVTPATVGAHTVVATYSGDSRHTHSTARYTLQVDRALTTVTPSVPDGGSVTYGRPLTATVAVQAPSRVSLPASSTGYAYVDGTLYDGLPVGRSRLTVPASALSGGDHTVQICVNTSDDLYGSCSPQFTVTVIPAAATVTLSATPDPATVGRTVTLSATVTPTATGVVDFYDGDSLVGSAGLVRGKAKLRTAFTSSGVHPLTAVYSGDGNYAGATSAELDEQVS